MTADQSATTSWSIGLNEKFYHAELPGVDYGWKFNLYNYSKYSEYFKAVYWTQRNVDDFMMTLCEVTLG